MRRSPRLSLSPARSRHQVHPVLPSDHCVRPGRAARAARAQPEPECLCGALGQVGEGGVPVQGNPFWRALPAAGAERICRTFPCRTESPREGQCPAVPPGYEHPTRSACSMPRATGRTLALLPSGGSVNGRGASDEFFDLTRSELPMGRVTLPGAIQVLAAIDLAGRARLSNRNLGYLESEATTPIQRRNTVDR